MRYLAWLHARRQTGVAIVAVMWMVAALSLIVVGVVHAVRQELQFAGQQRHNVVARGLGDAAILLGLQQLQQPGVQAPTGMRNLSVSFSGRQFQILVTPLNGRIDINKAPLPLLQDMYRFGGGLPQPQALALAQATVETRQRKDSSGQVLGFASVEDLLAVPGLRYGLYARLKSLVTVDLKDGSGLVNPKFAPTGVLHVLTGGDMVRAVALDAKRKSSPGDMDISFFTPSYVDASVSKSQRIEVDVEMPSGDTLRRTWDVFMGSDSRTGLPWRVLGLQQQVISLTQPEF